MARRSTAERPPAERCGPGCSRPTVRGKFLFAGNEKLFVRGATYGTFHPNRSGELYPSPENVSRDFADLANAGFNAVRTYTVPPPWLLDVAAGNGLLVMVGIAWEQHVDFLENRRRARSIEDRVRAGVAACAGHPAVLSYAVGNEIPSQIVRWLGRRPVERYIARLYRAAKLEDPGGLVTYVNYPPTEYLQLPLLDFMCFNVYLENRRALESYLARLHNIAGDRPLVMAEIGLDSRTHGELAQADVLDWQVRATFASGCAGAFVFAWTDEWYVSYLSDMAGPDDGLEIDDWDFGLTRRDRRPKPALEAVRGAFGETPFRPRHAWPRISVVVCSFNGEKTLRTCLDGLSRLDYPDFEVIVVNDGSTDSTPAIVDEREGFRLISTANRGLAMARNTGMRAATGKIVAYLDDDARPDQHWLKYLAKAFENGTYAGVGGLNLPPIDSPTVASCVADAPGGPSHVLVSDREAEHIPGCNMAFRKSALEEVGGFDPRFRVAGDDVDICWRLLDSGHKLGFSPAALVWHQPRGSVRAYWRQQNGYGKAEAMLERKWPNKYNTGGHARWAGRLYGRGLFPGFGRWRVYYGTWGSGLFQSLYAPGAGTVPSLLLAPEWYLWIAALALMSIVGLTWAPLLGAAPLFVAALAVPLALSGAGARRAESLTRPLPWREHLARWTLTAFLHLIQPLARMRGRLTGLARPARSRPRFVAPFPRAFKIWAEVWQSGERRLAEIEAGLRVAGALVVRGGVYDRWDLQARCGFIGAVRIRAGIEEHGAGRQLVRLHLTPRYPPATLALIGLMAALSLAAWLSNASLAAVVLAVAAVTLGACAVRAAGVAMSLAVRQVRAAEQSGRPARREMGKLKLEGT